MTIINAWKYGLNKGIEMNPNIFSDYKNNETSLIWSMLFFHTFTLNFFHIIVICVNLSCAIVLPLSSPSFHWWNISYRYLEIYKYFKFNSETTSERFREYIIYVIYFRLSFLCTFMRLHLWTIWAYLAIPLCLSSNLKNAKSSYGNFSILEDLRAG